MKLLHTVRLHPAEWLALLLLSATPLLVHELLAFFSETALIQRKCSLQTSVLKLNALAKSVTVSG